MKTRTILMHSYLVIAITLMSYHVHAQSVQAVKPGYSAAKQVVVNYTYKLFQAPNKMYGYDIFRNNKFIFHQPALLTMPGNSIVALSKKEYADKAALQAIEKIKKGQPAELSQDEIKKITNL